MEDNNFKKVTSIISIISLGLGIVLLIKEVYCIVFIANYKTYQDVVYLIGVSLVIGLAGTVFEQVFKSFIGKKIKEAIELYMPDNIKSFVEDKINEALETQMMIDKIDSRVEVAVDTYESEVEVEKAINDNENGNADKDTVIVAVTRTYDWNIENELYYCQKHRPLKNVKYISFYKDKIIKGIYEFEKISNIANINLPIDEELYKREDLIFYKLNKKVDMLNIRRIGKGAYIQSRKYVNSKSLLDAKDKTTGEIK